jgi:nucleotide-binding universal stress UspA family protein
MHPTIVCAVEQDRVYRQVLGLAGDLAERLGRELVVVHVAMPHLLWVGDPVATTGVIAPVAAVPYPAPLPADAEDEIFQERRRRTHDQVRRLVAEAGGGDARVEIAFDATVVGGLRVFAREHRAELLVVGSHGRGAARAALLGSTVHDLVRDAPCPVVVVPCEDAE